ncbi:hypothetical protein QOZ80_9BG0699030 [Eleusine coracana subsp. coracana]|nr:hypothetical protein QOZ80_9BG0699030 [Eleusine coracana subsp. coracana]
MRSGGCAVQQALSAEAAAVVRQAVALARRRGHAQVTPLHVASAMLSPSPPGAGSGPLRAACLRSHSHPLQCKALELCFNVALNRLPAAAAAVMFHAGGHAGYGGGGGGGGIGGHHHAPPVLSNALVAAFKRAQAHQRRGSGGEGNNQPPPLAAASSSNKVELEQLIVSILDDPSVSRVMREAGFCSSQVKANVDKAVTSAPPDQHHHHSSTTTTTTTSSPITTTSISRLNNAKVVDDDTMRVLDHMTGSGGSRTTTTTNKRRCAVVVVGESAATAEAVVKAVMDRVSKGELHPKHERLKNLQFVPLRAASFRTMAREEVGAAAGDLTALVRQGCAAGKGVVLVVEDLGFAADAWAAASERRRKNGATNCYCPVEHGVMEVSGLVAAAAGGLDRFWMLGFGNNQAYMRCRAGQPSLAAVWELHPVVVPDGSGVALSLSSSTSEAQQQACQERSRRTGWPFINGAETDGNGSDLVVARADVATPRPDFPQWLRGHQGSDHYGPESCTTSLQLQEHNRSCNGSAAHHPTSELTLSFSSLAATTNSPTPSSTPCFANNCNTNLTVSCKPWQFMPVQPWLNHRYDDPMAKSYDHQTLPANPSPESYSVSNSSESAGAAVQPKFTELTAENLKVLCNTLENHLPYYKDMAADIASAVLQCRSGMTRRRRKMWHNTEKPSVATWLLFQGRDSDGKKAVAQELARLVFGSYASFTSISLSNYTPLQSKSSSGEVVLKRQRSLDNNEYGFAQRLYDAILENPHQVIKIDGVDQLECESEIGVTNAIRNGRIVGCNGDEASLEDAIVILSCEALDSRSSDSSPWFKQRAIDNEGDEGNVMNMKKGTEPSSFVFDLNACVDDGEGDASDILNLVDGVFLFQLT